MKQTYGMLQVARLAASGDYDALRKYLEEARSLKVDAEHQALSPKFLNSLLFTQAEAGVNPNYFKGSECCAALPGINKKEHSRTASSGHDGLLMAAVFLLVLSLVAQS